MPFYATLSFQKFFPKWFFWNCSFVIYFKYFVLLNVLLYLFECLVNYSRRDLGEIEQKQSCKNILKERNRANLSNSVLLKLTTTAPHPTAGSCCAGLVTRESVPALGNLEQGMKMSGITTQTWRRQNSKWKQVYSSGQDSFHDENEKIYTNLYTIPMVPNQNPEIQKSWIFSHFCHKKWQDSVQKPRFNKKPILWREPLVALPGDRRKWKFPENY